MESTTPVLECRGLSFSYDGRPVLSDVTFWVDAGEMVAVVGPNGAGKSTLLRLAAGLLRPHRGLVRFFGRDIADYRGRALARQVALLSQTSELPPDFTCLELVLLGRAPHLRLWQWESCHDLEVARWAMERTGTLHLAQRLVGRLSGGERQRVLLARALAQEAPLLLLDEPTAHLDLRYQSEMLDLIRELWQGRGGAVVMVSHDSTLAAMYSQRVLLLQEGMVVAQGAPAAVLSPENIARVFGPRAEVVQVDRYPYPLVLPKSLVPIDEHNP